MCPVLQQRTLRRVEQLVDCVFFSIEIRLKNFEVLDQSDNWIAAKCEIGSCEIIIITVYLRVNFFHERVKALSNCILDIIERFDCPMIIGGDFNARIGRGNQLDENLTEDTWINYSRNSQDVTLNGNDVAVLESFEDMGLFVLNGRSYSDFQGNYSFLGKSNTTIDMSWINRTCIDCVRDFSVLNIGALDVLSIKLWLDIDTERIVEILPVTDPPPRVLKWILGKQKTFKCI